MKTKWIAALALGATVLSTLAVGAGARSPVVTAVAADLVLRPGVGVHPQVEGGLYGAFDGSYNRSTGKLAYTLDYRGLSGTAIRAVVRSRVTGAAYVVLCSPCHPVFFKGGLKREGSVVLKVTTHDHLAGFVPVDPDVGFLITHGRTFVQLDTTAYPSGEIAGPIYVPPTFGPGRAGELPRCC